MGYYIQTLDEARRHWESYLGDFDEAYDHPTEDSAEQSIRALMLVFSVSRDEFRIKERG